MVTSVSDREIFQMEALQTKWLEMKQEFISRVADTLKDLQATHKDLPSLVHNIPYAIINKKYFDSSYWLPIFRHMDKVRDVSEFSELLSIMEDYFQNCFTLQHPIHYFYETQNYHAIEKLVNKAYICPFFGKRRFRSMYWIVKNTHYRCEKEKDQPPYIALPIAWAACKFGYINLLDDLMRIPQFSWTEFK